MKIVNRKVEYQDGDTVLEGYMSWNDDSRQPLPAVLVVHAWGGRGDYECERADLLAELGYVGFAIDVYGKGKLAADALECERFMQPFIDDRALLLRRLEAALESVKLQPEVDSSRVAAVGYCFGGLCVLDMARADLDVAGVVSLHGLFDPPEGRDNMPISSKVLVLHGWDDPMVLPAKVLALARELTERKADWQIHAYGHAVHAFTNPYANDDQNGIKYDAGADRRSWHAVQEFLSEVLV